jgi:GAF domain-containing protein
MEETVIEDLQEESRLDRLRQIGILDTPDSRLFRSFAEQALDLLPGTCIAAVSLVDAERQWFKTIVGLDVKETPRAYSFCSHTITTPGGTMVVEDATKDERFAKNPLVTGSPGIRFYVGVKLMDGVGALCVIGKQPRGITERELAKLEKLSQYVDIQLMAHGTYFNLK